MESFISKVEGRAFIIKRNILEVVSYGFREIFQHNLFLDYLQMIASTKCIGINLVNVGFHNYFVKKVNWNVTLDFNDDTFDTANNYPSQQKKMQMHWNKFSECWVP